MLNRTRIVGGTCALTGLYFGFDLCRSVMNGVVHGKFDKVVLRSTDPGLFWFDVGFYAFGVVMCLAIAFVALRGARAD